jgi:hypothetical protein
VKLAWSEGTGAPSRKHRYRIREAEVGPPHLS